MNDLTFNPNSIAVGESTLITVPNTFDSAVAVIWKGMGDFSPAEGEIVELAEVGGSEVAISVHGLGKQPQVKWSASDIQPGSHTINADVVTFGKDFKTTSGKVNINTVLKAMNNTKLVYKGTVVVTSEPLVVKEPVSVTMRRAATAPTDDQALWTVIRQSAKALSFNSYNDFMDDFLCSPGTKERDSEAERIRRRLKLPFPDTDAYRQLKVATEVFLMANCGVAFKNPTAGFKNDSSELAAERRRYNDPALQPRGIENLWRNLLSQKPLSDNDVNGKPVQTLPYLAIVRRKLNDVTVVGDQKADGAATACLGILMDKLTQPCLIELIWSYWHEEGMLAQTMNALTWRFQNRRGPADRDPLALLEIDPLRPLNNFIWGYVQDEQHRLTVPRRAYEYDHHYGLTLQGKAVPQVRGADSRSRFLEGFHNLLFRCSLFFKEDDDTTVVADGFPVLNALKEVHLQLTQGAHNQYGDLPWTARHEMLMQQWLLARPEFREFLPSRIMVDYPEPWMDRVETMKTLQGWTDTSVMHFRDLGVFGEQILLGVRFGAWPSIIEPESAANWARYWRPEIQGYIHAYRAVTGADLTERVDATPPSILLLQRLNASGTRALPPRRIAVARTSQPQRALR